MKKSCGGLLLVVLFCFAAHGASEPVLKFAQPGAEPEPSAVSPSTEVTISPSTMQLNEAKSFFDTGDYEHLSHTSDNSSSLSLQGKGVGDP